MAVESCCSREETAAMTRDYEETTAMAVESCYN